MKIVNEKTPGYILLSLWVLFTIVTLIWIAFASLSTSRAIMQGKVFTFPEGIHPENFARAWGANNISVFFFNSALYSVVGTFFGFIMAMSLPSIMIVLPLFSLATQLHLTGTKIILLILCSCMAVPFTTIFLITFFANLSKTYEEAAAIDGYSPMRTFWTIMLPLAQPGIVTVGIFNFMNIWNEYFMSLVFGSSSKNMSVGPGLKSVLASMQYTGDWGDYLLQF